jgi:hypothetical protein
LDLEREASDRRKGAVQLLEAFDFDHR